MKQIIGCLFIACLFCGLTVFAQPEMLPASSEQQGLASASTPVRLGFVITPLPTKTPTPTPTRSPTRTPRRTPTPTPTVVRHTTIEAASFNFIAGTPDFTVDGLVGGASTSPSATGVANVALGDGTVVNGFTVCGRDDASDQEFAGALKRKTIDPVNSAFTPPQIMAQVHSGIPFFSNAMACLKSSIAAATAVIDNSKFTYYVEIDVGNTTEVIAATIDH